MWELAIGEGSSSIYINCEHLNPDIGAMDRQDSSFYKPEKSTRVAEKSEMLKSLNNTLGVKCSD